jgi:hypothetical protein
MLQKSPREEKIAFINHIRGQKNKKRRGMLNKNEVLYAFIDHMHRVQGLDDRQTFYEDSSLPEADEQMANRFSSL